MKRMIALFCCIGCIFCLNPFFVAESASQIKIITPRSGEIISGLFTVKVEVISSHTDIFLCLVFQDGSIEHKQMFQEGEYYYCNIDSRTFSNGSLYFFVKTGKQEELIDDSLVLSVMIDNSISSLLGKIEPSLARNGTNILVSLQANIPLKNVWASIDDKIKFDLQYNNLKNQWESNFYIPQTFIEGSHSVLLEGIDSGANSVKTYSSFMVCNTEPFFVFPLTGATILNKHINLRGIFSPGDEVFIYKEKQINHKRKNVFVASSLTSILGEWVVKQANLEKGINSFSVFSKKQDNPVETFPYQSVKVNQYDKGLVVLNYHNIEKNGGTYSRTPEQFREDLDFLKTNGFNPITPILFLSFLEGKGDLPDKPVLITFDDGLTGVYLNAYPLLKEFGYTAIMFIIVSRIGQNLDYLNWKQLSEMQSSRIFSVESHTYNSHFFVDNISGRHAALISKLILPDGSIESEEQYVNRVTDDLQKSKTIIEEKLNKKVLFLAIPFGIGDATITKISTSLGLKGIFNSGGGVNPLPIISWNVKRITIKSTDLLSDFLN